LNTIKSKMLSNGQKKPKWVNVSFKFLINMFIQIVEFQTKYLLSTRITEWL